MSLLFTSYEIGSFPKLAARVKALRGSPVSDGDRSEILRLAALANVDDSEIIGILDKQRADKSMLTPQEKDAIIDFNALLNLRLQEQSGLDVVYDGEARRLEMYRNVARQISGFRDLPEMIRSRGPDSWRAAVCVDEPKLNVSLDELPIIKEFEFVKKNARRPIKVPIDDPYMVAVMSDNRFYAESLKSQYEGYPKKLSYEAKRAFNMALARNIIRPQVEALARVGANWIQLDAPAATIDIEHIPILVEGINEVVRGIEGVKFSLHICYPRRFSLTDKSGYELLFPHLLQLNQKVNHLSLELANGCQYEKDLAPFAQYQDQRKFKIAAGVVDITLERAQKGLLETPEMVRGRLIKTANVLRDPNLVYATLDCGLRQVSYDNAIARCRVLVEGRELARKG